MVNWAARVEDHLLSVMYLAYTVPGISYEAALHWPTWKLVSRVRHCGHWVERDNRLMEKANR